MWSKQIKIPWERHCCKLFEIWERGMGTRIVYRCSVELWLLVIQVSVVFRIAHKRLTKFPCKRLESFFFCFALSISAIKIASNKLRHENDHGAVFLLISNSKRWMNHSADFICFQENVYHYFEDAYHSTKFYHLTIHPNIIWYRISQTDIRNVWTRLTHNRKEFIYINKTFFHFRTKSQIILVWLLSGKPKLTKQKINVKVDYLVVPCLNRGLLKKCSMKHISVEFGSRKWFFSSSN